MESIETKAQANARRVREYRARHKERLKQERAADKAANPDKYYKYRKDSHVRHPETRMLALAKQRALKKGLQFNITKEDVLVPDSCPVLGIPLFIADEGFSDNSPTIDRIDSKQGYVKGNVLVVSWRANRIKVDATPDELRKVASFYSALENEQ